MRAWHTVADGVFTVARQPQVGLLRQLGASDVRFIPQTYCHMQFADFETPKASDAATILYDAVVIGGGIAHFGMISRVPGASSRASLVRRLQRRKDLRLAVYGAGWRGRGSTGSLPYNMQVRAL